MKRLLVIAVFGVALLSLSENHAAEQKTVSVKAEFADKLASNPLLAPASVSVEKLIADPFRQKELMDALLKKVWASDHTNAILGLLNDLHLRPKVFHAEGEDAEAVLGFEYAYEKSIAGRVLNPDSRNPFGLSVNFHANGNVAASARKNPDSFLDTGIKFSLFQAVGGVEPLMYSEDAARQANIAASNATHITTTGADRERDPRWQAATKGWNNHVLPQFLWVAAGNASFEADQQFNNKQWAYGGQVGVSLRDWRDEHWISWVNLPDYPFALIRYLLEDGPFQPSGHSFPTLLGGVDLIDPSDNADRLNVDPDNGVYPRLRGEVAFKTPVGRMLSKEVWFTASYRFFQELGASSAIRAANMERFNYLVAKVDFLGGFNVSYSAGKLPLDRNNDQVFALGYTINF